MFTLAPPLPPTLAFSTLLISLINVMFPDPVYKTLDIVQ